MRATETEQKELEIQELSKEKVQKREKIVRDKRHTENMTKEREKCQR